jgi:hypothetical protein
MTLNTPLKLLFLDTEFTSLGEPWPVQLISAGLADSQGRPIFYAECDDFDPCLAHEFTQSKVIPLLERGAKAMPYEALCESFFKAISDMAVPCAIAADSDWDWLWVQMMAMRQQNADGPSLLDNPSGLPLWPTNLSPSMAKINFHDLSRIDKLASWEASSLHFRDKYPHHALVDAIGNAKCCKAAIEANPGLNSDDPSAFCKVFKQNLATLSWQTSFKPKL